MTLDPAIADMERRWKESGIPGLYSGSGPDIGVGVYDQAEGTVDAARRGAVRARAGLAARP